MADANAVRPADTLISFPADRVLWARVAGDQVAVTHRGQTKIYQSPHALRDAIDDVDRRGRKQLAEVEAAEVRARDLVEKALRQYAAATADRRRARAILRLVEAGVLLGTIAAIVAFGLGVQL